MSEYQEQLPKFEFQEVTDADQGIKKGLDGFEAVHFLGGEKAKHLGPEGCEDLLLQWGDISHVVAVKIGPNSIDDKAIESLCQLLQKNDSLLYFSLYTNHVTKPCGGFFATMLSVNKTLVSLQLVDNKIDDATFKIICGELETGNRTLLQADFSSNQITDSGAKAFGKVMKVNDILTTVSLASNDIGVDGGTALMKALEVNFTLCDLYVLKNNVTTSQASKIEELCDRNKMTIREAMDYCNANVKAGPLRKAKICFVGKNGSGKTTLIESLKGQGYQDFYQPTEGVKVTQVLTRLRGEMWYGTCNVPSAAFAYHFLSKFINIKLDENIDKIEREKPKEIGFAGLRKKKNRRGSVKQRRASVTGQRKAPTEKALAAEGRNSVTNRQSAMGRRSSVAMSVLNAVLGDPGRVSRNSAVKELVGIVSHPFNRVKNDLLEDSEYTFYGDGERGPGEAKQIYDTKDLHAAFDTVVTAKARRERDNLSFNLMELSGDRIFYTVHHAFLTAQAVYVLNFNMAKLSNKKDQEGRLEEIKYMNYWLKVIKYHSPNAKLMVVGTHANGVPKELYAKLESDVTKLVFPDLYKAHAKKKQALQVNKAVGAANDFAATLEEGTSAFVDKKTRLIVNSKEKRLFFPVELSTGKGVSNIRLALDAAAQEQKYYGQKIPVSWMKFLDALRKDSPLYFCKPARVKALAFQTLDNDKEDMKAALELFHELGYIVYVTDIDELKDTVITDTLSFYRIMFRLIFTEDLAVFNLTDARKQHPDAVEEMLKTGVLDQEFLDYLWMGETRLNLSGDISEKEAKNAKQFFLEYAQLNLILSTFNFNNKKRYIVPSMIPVNTDIVAATREKYEDGMNLKCKFQFKGYLTLGVFERLLCLCIQFASSQENSLEPILAMGWAQISFGVSYVFRLVREPDDIIVHVVEAKKKKKVYKLIESFEKMMLKLRQILGQGFNWTTTLEDGEGEYIPYAKAKEQKLKGWFA